MVIGLAFYDDDTFELSVDQDGEDGTVGNGDYEETDDGVTLTITGPTVNFDEPEVVELLWDADDTLIIPAETEGLEVEEDIILYADFSEADDESDDEEGGDTGEMVHELGGVYFSPVNPGEEGAGLYVLNLMPDGNASFSSDAFNLEAPTNTSWERGRAERGDGTVTVEITGTPDEEFDEPIILTYEVTEYGDLILNDLFFFPLSIFMDGGEISGEHVGEGVEPLSFVAEVLLPDEEEPTNIYMVRDDSSVSLSDEDGTGTIYGEWSYDEADGTLTLSMTSDDESDFDEPVELVFEWQDDDTLVGVEYPTEIFGEDDLTFYPEDASGEEATEEEATEEESSEEGAVEGEEEAEVATYNYESDVLTGAKLTVRIVHERIVLRSCEYDNRKQPQAPTPHRMKRCRADLTR